jgi:hypothetical protein
MTPATTSPAQSSLAYTPAQNPGTPALEPKYCISDKYADALAERRAWNKWFEDCARTRKSQNLTDEELISLTRANSKNPFKYGELNEWERAQVKEEQCDAYAADWDDLRVEKLPEQKVLLTANGEPCLRSETLNEIFAYRGIGKSMLVAGMIRLLIQGGELLTFKSEGGNRVLLVDGELPAGLLQERLKKQVGDTAPGSLMVRSIARLPGHRMPPLSHTEEQKLFLEYVERSRPDVIIFDTRTAVFKHDTNDQGQLLAVNDFLIQLRSYGFCVLITHHAGKNGTQRGRTDNDDDLDLIMKLDKREGWEPGMGLEFKLAFEKIRYGDRLQPFDARLDRLSGWQLIGKGSINERVVKALMAGRSVNPLSKELGIGIGTLLGIKRRAESEGLVFPVNSPGRRKKGSDEEGGEGEE